MTFEPVSSPLHPLYSRAMELYALSFPYHEQRRPSSQERILKNSEYNFLLIMDEGRFSGLMLCWETAGFIYVEHFCILPELRGRGIGAAALELLGRRGKTLILEIDPPVDDISRRRQGFYERAGFVSNCYEHVHPTYHQDCSGHSLVLMSSPRPLSPPEYRAFADYLSRVVMDGALTD